MEASTPRDSLILPQVTIHLLDIENCSEPARNSSSGIGIPVCRLSDSHSIYSVSLLNYLPIHEQKL